MRLTLVPAYQRGASLFLSARADVAWRGLSMLLSEWVRHQGVAVAPALG